MHWKSRSLKHRAKFVVSPETEGPPHAAFPAGLSPMHVGSQGSLIPAELPDNSWNPSAQADDRLLKSLVSGCSRSRLTLLSPRSR